MKIWQIVRRNSISQSLINIYKWEKITYEKTDGENSMTAKNQKLEANLKKVNVGEEVEEVFLLS